MKLLFDQNLSHKLLKEVEVHFPRSAHVKLLGLDQASDADIWRYAREKGFTIVTQDADFEDHVDLFGHPPKVIWLRCGNQPSAFVAKLLQAHAKDILAFEQNPQAGCLEIFT